MTDVIIIGAGPAGLMLGCELLKRGIQIRLFEQLPERTQQSRALALQARTLEIFEKMGIIDEFMQLGKKVHHANIYKNGRRIASVNISQIDAPYPFILTLAQADTEMILARHFEKLGGNIERCKTLTAINGSQAVFQIPNKTEETVSARWIIGCDGAHSTVRHILNMPFQGAAFPETFALADVEVDSPFSDDETHLFFSSNKLAGLLPLPERNHFRALGLISTDKSGQVPELTLENVQQMVEEASNSRLIRLKNPTWISTFSVHRRLVPQMRRGNIFLVGDAAHIHSPAGGQGMNTSVQDAFNLAWKLALVQQGSAKERILDTYHQERHPVAREVLKGTTLITNMLTASKAKMFIVALLGLLINHTALQKKMAYAISELRLRYGRNILNRGRLADLFWKGPKPGCRTPDVAELPDGKRLFQYLAHPRHTLLCFGNAEALISQVQEEFPNLIVPIIVSPSQQGPGYIHDPSGQIAKRYLVEKEALYLIRPDGVIGYRCRDLKAGPFLRHLKSNFIGKSKRS
ncbi:MAG: FAD-dependent monooxygenase [Parachlamydiales bacterium]